MQIEHIQDGWGYWANSVTWVGGFETEADAQDAYNEYRKEYLLD